MNYENTGGYHIRNQYAPHFLTFTIDGWIDLFTREKYVDIILNSFEFCRKNKGLKIYGFVIMSNHLHVIWKAEHGNLSDIIRDFKTFTSKEMVYAVQTNDKESRKEWLIHMFQYFANGTNANVEYKVWRSGSHPEEIFSEEFFYSKLEYIHNNPVKAGIVELAEEYIYSSARNFTKRKSIFEIDIW